MQILRRDLVAPDDAQAIAQWEHGGVFSVDGLVRSAVADHAGDEPVLRCGVCLPFALCCVRAFDPEHLP